MGIVNFFPFIARKVPRAVEPLDVNALRHARLGIDAPVLLCRACASSTESQGYLMYLVEQLAWLASLECEALFVFDGPEHAEYKQPARAARAAQRARQEQLLRESEESLARATAAEDWDAVLECRARSERHARACFCAGVVQRQAMQNLLTCLGWAWCVAPAEGEAYLSALQLEGRLDYVVTEDSDALICGSSCILRGFWSLGPCGHGLGPGQAQLVRGELLLAGLGLTAAELRMTAVLAGCDFAPKLPRVGLCRALAASQRCGADLAACLGFLRCEISNEHRKQMERALLILQPPAVSWHTAAPRRPVVLDELHRLVADAEAAGDSGVLRDALLRERPVVPDLVPAAWTASGISA